MRVVKIDQGSDPDPQIELAQIQLEHPTVLVIWRDAFFDFDQSDAEDIRPDYLVHTVGFLVAEGPKFVSLAQEILPDGDGFRAVTHIPMSIVERIERLDVRALPRSGDGRWIPHRARVSKVRHEVAMLLGRRDEQMTMTSASVFTTPRPSATR